ncbi:MULTISPECIES: hypothetical protein [unclassified Sphingomonas]|uniref:hypothetical protein n=1 Tax=Novosphingobium rhizosphaerae TaxID=1551649 RepID=UPI0015C99392
MAKLRWAIALPACLALAVPPAGAQGTYCGAEPPDAVFAVPHFDDEQMTYSVIEQGGVRVLYASGGVGDEEGSRLAAALSQAGNVDEVWLSSPGGNLEQGMAMGRALRARRVLVRVPQGRACISACTVAFLGGALRTVDNGGYYGIHMFSLFFDKKEAAARQVELMKLLVAAERVKKGTSSEVYREIMMDYERGTALAAGRLARYLVEMSASLEFLGGMFGQRQLGVCFVNDTGLRRYNIVNIE